MNKLRKDLKGRTTRKPTKPLNPLNPLKHSNHLQLRAKTNGLWYPIETIQGSRVFLSGDTTLKAFYAKDLKIRQTKDAKAPKLEIVALPLSGMLTCREEGWAVPVLPVIGFDGKKAILDTDSVAPDLVKGTTKLFFENLFFYCAPSAF